MKAKDFGIQYKSNNEGHFDLEINVKKDASGRIVSGLVLGPTLEQNIACILIAEPGDFKENLSLGVGIRSALLDEDLLPYRHQIREQFSRDGLYVSSLDFYDISKFKINAAYED
ncbi:hypothetical protein EGI16_21510 [Chryseobacterium sp. G0240]|uniref:hypothetical protein n=1 Tax=Chryseobacterium sp. G0240 TaxID=2487066 RepID=UPI000F45AD9D|nr:hypothetical protein [Chryseobacterium sp. G0240]ROH98415.1 hypothetical protein EGI16_21510 [Chryseobacterium sp. G0240]